jgi:hypothetical protein
MTTLVAVTRRVAVDPIRGVMWHPERCEPFADADVRPFRQLLREESR